MSKERPILFSGPLVRAILEGRKTQTRRMVTPQPVWVEGRASGEEYAFWHWDKGVRSEGTWPPGPHRFRYGVPGDRLWVRETFAIIWRDLDGCPVRCGPGDHPEDCPDYDAARRFCPTHDYIEYRADTGNPLPGDWPEEYRGDDEVPSWRPSIHMPRWASRIDLEVVSVRPERLHNITEEDAIAEGVEPVFLRTMVESARGKFAELWDSINGKRPGASWEANPWVWRVEFRRLGVPHA